MQCYYLFCSPSSSSCCSFNGFKKAPCATTSILFLILWFIPKEWYVLVNARCEEMRSVNRGAVARVGVCVWIYGERKSTTTVSLYLLRIVRTIVLVGRLLAFIYIYIYYRRGVTPTARFFADIHQKFWTTRKKKSLTQPWRMTDSHCDLEF
jgi:hypothetical protein